ncbi:MAG: DegV family protein [Lachnospiraceae bacterium]|jgi:DegV family protein with EDD domain|nr:DegV family protein [Lachnospiraceae bacterium]NBJ82223.1 DegV family protein [bacterium 1XD42-76]NBK05649.1 DegV family protein [bacterium 1XD42-94]
MRYRIIGDSSLELAGEWKDAPFIRLIPFTMLVGEEQFTDDETFDQKEFLEAIKNCPDCPKSACPSPDMYKEAYCCEEENVFVITISGPLSGSYNSAVLAKKLYEEEYGEKNIAVINSESAGGGLLNIALKIRDLCEQGLSFQEIEKQALKYRDSMKTYFVLETLDTLRKNGRLTGLQAYFATKLNIKPVMSAEKGVIIKLDQARGIQKALQKLVEIALKHCSDAPNRRLIISHCNTPERAEYIRERCQAAGFKEIIITGTSGLNTMYANDGGLIVTL